MLLGALTTGAGIASVFPGQSQCESLIVIGSVSTAFPLQGVQIEVNGIPFFNVSNNATLLGAYVKWMSQFVATAPSIVLKVSTGRIPLSTTYRFTNNGATTPNIYVTSDNDMGVPFLVGTKQINASSFEDFEKFSALFISAPANISSAEIVFRNGTKSTMSFQELDALFSLKSVTDANGELNACSVIDNRDQQIRSVRLYSTGAALTVLIAKIPDASFDLLKKQAR